MYRILKAERLADKIYLMDVEAPRVARVCQPGEFVIVKMDEVGERIPLTICDFDREKGTVTIVFQVVGASTFKMASLKEGDAFRDFVGPLGQPSEFVKEPIEEVKKRKYLFVAGGVGAAPVYPQVKWMKEHGIDVDVIVGSKTKDLLLLEKEMKAQAGNLYITTDDGSYMRKGMVTAVIEDLVKNQGRTYDVCVAIGPMIMMKFVCKLTKELGIHTIVSMNPVSYTHLYQRASEDSAGTGGGVYSTVSGSQEGEKSGRLWRSGAFCPEDSVERGDRRRRRQKTGSLRGGG